MAVFTLEGCGGTVQKWKDAAIDAICSSQVRNAIDDLKNEAKNLLETACDKLDSATMLQCKQTGEQEIQVEAQQDEAEMTANCTKEWNERTSSATAAFASAADWVRNFISDSKDKLAEYRAAFLALVEKHSKGTEVCNPVDTQSECEAKACCNWRMIDIRHQCESKVGDNLCGSGTDQTQQLFVAGGAVVMPKGASTQSVLVGFGALVTLVGGSVICGVRMVRARASAASSNRDCDTVELLDDSEDIE